MRPFEGFKRKAIVIVPTDEEFRRRIAQREKEEGKEVPETAVLEMKGSFLCWKWWYKVLQVFLGFTFNESAFYFILGSTNW